MRSSGLSVAGLDETMETNGTNERNYFGSGQAARFWVAKPRATRDLDFVLDVTYLCGYEARIAPILERLEYSPVDNARNFQFEKRIRESDEVMRIEFLAPAEFGRKNQIRVDVQEGLHGRACTGGSIVLAEADQHEIVGALPDGTPTRASIRVTRPHALTMLKLIALDERYRNIRGAPHAEHGREEARTHTGELVAVMSAQLRRIPRTVRGTVSQGRWIDESHVSDHRGLFWAAQRTRCDLIR